MACQNAQKNSAPADAGNPSLLCHTGSRVYCSPNGRLAVGYLYAFTAALLFGANGSVTKVMIEAGLTALQVTQFRVLGAALIAGVVLAILDPRSFRIPREQWSTVAWMGVAGVAMLQATYAIALELIPVGIALLLEYLAVPMVALFALLVFKERVRTRIWVSIGLIVLGLVIVAQIWNASLNIWGVVAGIGAALSLAAYLLIGERGLKTISPLALMFWVMLIAAVFWAVFSSWWTIEPAIWTESVSLSGSLENYSAPMWMLLVWNVVMGSFITFLMSLQAIKLLSATAAGIAATSEVAFAFVVAWLWLQESLNTFQLLGAAVVLGGIILAQTARRSPVPVNADLALETGPIVLPEWVHNENKENES